MQFAPHAGSSHPTGRRGLALLTGSRLCRRGCGPDQVRPSWLSPEARQGGRSSAATGWCRTGARGCLHCRHFLPRWCGGPWGLEGCSASRHFWTGGMDVFGTRKMHQSRVTGAAHGVCASPGCEMWTASHRGEALGCPCSPHSSPGCPAAQPQTLSSLSLSVVSLQ